MQNWFQSQQANLSDGKDALAIAFNAANAVQNRASSIREEINRVKQNKRHTKDMVDDNYCEPVLSADFHNELTISPGGLVYNPSLKLIDYGEANPISRN